MQLILFYIFSGITLLSALFVVTASRPTRALLSLILAMFALAVIYLLLDAPFLAMTHLIVYAGAVLVLFLFVIMLQGVGAKEIPLLQRFPLWQILLSITAAGSFFILLLCIKRSLDLPSAVGVIGTVEVVGQSLLTGYLLPFELTSFLLLIGVFAAVSLARKDEP